MATLVIGADLCPIGRNRPLFVSGDAQSLFHDLLKEFAAADLVVANLECPLIEKATPILKTGPVFGAPSECILGIKEAGIDLLCLANNHILDHGAEGLMNTLRVCSDAGIATVGAGANLAAARRILIREIDSLRIGVLAMAEHEFSIATRDTWGANPLDLIEYVRSVKRHEGELDFLLVLVHGSHEFHVPTPRTRDTCRFLVEMGADAVIVQHPHCLGGMEEHEGAPIVYGQGALVMDEEIYRDLGTFHDGFLVRLLIAKGKAVTLELVPFVQSNPGPGAEKMLGEPEAEFRKSLEKRSRTIQDDALLEAEWVSFCASRRRGYLSGLLGHNRIVRMLDVHGLLTKLLYGRRQLLAIKNALCCETHREAVETLFREGLI